MLPYTRYIIHVLHEQIHVVYTINEGCVIVSHQIPLKQDSFDNCIYVSFYQKIIPIETQSSPILTYLSKIVLVLLLPKEIYSNVPLTQLFIYLHFACIRSIRLQNFESLEMYLNNWLTQSIQYLKCYTRNGYSYSHLKF